MKIADFYDDTVRVTVEHRGRTFEIDCYPERATEALLEEANAAAEAQGGAVRGEWLYIHRTVAGWTLEDPFGEESVLAASRGFRRAIIGAVQAEAANPTPAESAQNSQSTSAAAASTGDAQAGTASPAE